MCLDFDRSTASTLREMRNSSAWSEVSASSTGSPTVFSVHCFKHDFLEISHVQTAKVVSVLRRDPESS